MIKLLLLFVGFATLLFFGSTWVGQKGYVLIAFGQWTIETSVVAAIAMLIIAYIVWHGLVVAIISLFKLKKITNAWQQKRQNKHAFTNFENALSALFNQEYQVAEKLSTKQAEQSPLRKSHYLLAAEAAKLQGNYEQHAQYSLRAVEQGSEIEKQLVLVQNLSEEGKLDKALEKAEALHQKAPTQSQTLVLLAMLYKEANRYQALVDILKLVKKHCQLVDEVFECLVAKGYTGLFKQYSQSKDLKQLNKLQQQLQKISNQPEKLAHLYVNALVQAGFHTEAEKYILKALKAEANEGVLHTLKQSELQQPNKLITWLEQAIKKQPDNYLLISALGYVAASAREWSLAQKALETCLRQQVTPDELEKLGYVFEQLNQPTQALNCYRKALTVK